MVSFLGSVLLPFKETQFCLFCQFSPFFPTNALTFHADYHLVAHPVGSSKAASRASSPQRESRCASRGRGHTEVLGQGRLGVRLSSLIATLRTVMRLPIRQIRQLLLSLHGVEVSIGEIVEVLHRISLHAQPLLDDLKATIRACSAVQADAHGMARRWPQWIYLEREYPNHAVLRISSLSCRRSDQTVAWGNLPRRAGKRLLCRVQHLSGLSSTDARVHSLRDLHKLKDKYPDEQEVWRWAKAVKDGYDQAVAGVAQEPDPGWSPRQLHQRRVAQQQVFEQQLWAICQPYVGTTAPQQVLCKRVEDFLPELFVFVAVPGVPAHNNLAERSVRPLVIARKISGGSRSPKGSQTRMGLVSLFGTWMAQGLNPFSQCLALLTGNVIIR